MKIEKKHIIVVGLGVISLALAGAYWQYKKMMNYCIGLNRIQVNNLSGKNADINVYLDFQNKSDLKINIESQEYKVSINNTEITKITNSATQVIAPSSTSIIGVNVKFNPEKAGTSVLNILASMKPVTIKIDIKLKVKLWMITVSIPYIYETTLKELMAPSKTPKTTKKCN